MSKKSKHAHLHRVWGARSLGWVRGPAPHWWPHGEPWPPDHRSWRATRRKLFPRLVLGVLAALIISTTLCSGGVLLLVLLVGQVDLPLGVVGGGVLGAGLLVSLVMLIAGRSLRRVISPLDTLLEASERVAAGHYDVAVPERGAPEVRALAAGFNEMVRRLRAQSEERQDLLADVTHELRTPLTVLQGNLEGMLDGVYPRDEAHLQSSLDETRILADLVEDLRTLALAERSALELRVEATDLAQLVSETVTSFRPAADAKGVALEVAAQDLPPVEVDPLRMRQVLTNLLANALQFTGGGDRVSIRVYAGSTDDVAIEVDDSGPGIQAEELPRIFDRFYKSPDSAGTGLGLAIAAQLVHAHGGEIHAQSEPGHGTRMTVTLPA